jgi:surface polysaccharide O-acyltransferase-like enzyme
MPENELAIRGGQRVPGLDVIRSCAILFVIGGHYFLHTEFNSTNYHGVSMFLLGMWQTLIMINVPLFLLLTGYLNCNKQVGRKYYKNCVRVLISYVFISIVTIAFRKYYCQESYSIVQWILKIFDFSAIPYAWYIEMWIGLFFLVPFLNVLWKNIESKRNKRILIFTLYLCTALPDFFNRYGVSLAPGYWANISPICYYFIGCYIREYQPKIVTWKLILVICGICLINPALNLILAYGRRPMLHLIGTGDGIFVIPLAAIFFIACYRIDIKKRFISSSFAKISVLSLDMYLVSYIFDIMTYGWFKERFAYEPNLWGELFFAIIPTIFVGSFIFAFAKEKIFKLIHIPT